jgi:hypothetical protein
MVALAVVHGEQLPQLGLVEHAAAVVVGQQQVVVLG